MHSSYGEVARFLQAAVRAVVPFGLFGSEHNRAVVFKGIQEFVMLSRYERFSLENAMTGFRVTHCEWSKGGGPAAASPPSDHSKRTDLVASFLKVCFLCFCVCVFVCLCVCVCVV
jgi:hypothetical protein